MCIWIPTYSHIFLTQPPKLWSAHLRWRKSLPPQLLHPPKRSPPQSWPRRSLSLWPLLPRCLLRKIRPPSCWRITSHIWDPSLVLTTGSSTPPEESLVWYSTDELARLLIYVHTTPVLLLFQSSLIPAPLSSRSARPEFLSILSIRFKIRCVLALSLPVPFSSNSCFILPKMQLQ